MNGAALATLITQIFPTKVNSGLSVVISTTATNPVAQSFIVTITFSQSVSGFVVGDLSLSNCSASNFSTSDNITFSVLITPGSSSGTLTVQVPADVCTSVSTGKSNSASNIISLSYVQWWLAGGIAASTNYTIYDPVAAADLASSYSNLANPGTRDALPVVAPTFFALNGYTTWNFNGTTQHINSQTIIGDVSTMIVWAENCGAAGYVIGAQDISPTRYTTFAFRNSTETSFLRGASARDVNGDSRGAILAMNNSRCYINGVDVGAVTAWSGATGNKPIYIGCMNANGTAANFSQCRVLRVAIYPGVALTAAQIEAVTQAMFSYNQAVNNSYTSRVLALSPICYYPLNHTYGSPVFDISGRKAHSVSYFLLPGAAGQYGTAISGDSDANHFIRAIPGWDVLSGLNLNEYSVAYWIRVTTTPANQVRASNMYARAGLEYSALEIRSGTSIGGFQAENGSTEDTGTIGNTVNNTWMHLVYWNSLSQGKFGIYLNGVKAERTKTLSGFFDTSPDPTYPFHWQMANGQIQHIAYFDHALTQSEVNAIYP